jgi:hypothetical protein
MENKTSTNHENGNDANRLLCAALSLEELKTKIGQNVIDESLQVGKLIDVRQQDDIILVFIDCSSNQPYWMKSKYVWFA